MRRRMVFQLTPLLDLMLIVVFAQFLEMQDRTRTEQEKFKKTTLEKKIQLETELQTNTALIEKLKGERDRVANLAKTFLDIPAEIVDQAIEVSEDDSPELKRKIQALSRSISSDPLRRLLTVDRLQESCDVWEIFIDDRSQVHITAEGNTTKFRADTPDEFARNLSEFAKPLKSKSLVIIQLSWGDATATSREAARLGLFHAVDRLRQERLGRTVFESILLGFQPEEARKE